MTTALPPSHEAKALRVALSSIDGALPGVVVHLAVVRAGALQFVTPAPPLDHAMWRLIDGAVATGRVATATVGGRAWAVISVPASQEADDDTPSGVLMAQRIAGADGFSEPDKAILRLLTMRLQAVVADADLRGRMLELMGEYMGTEVADVLLHQRGPAKGDGSTRDISVLFADLRGFTSLSERLAPDAVVALLNTYFARAVPAITRHGGTVSAFIGDAIMGLFGAAATQTEHPLLAARAALDLRDAVEDIAEGVDAPRFRVGVATGPATVGNIGSPRRRVYTAIGDTVNLASRLEGAATVGQVLISEETYATIRVVADTEEVPPLSLKGKREPVRAWILHGLRAGAEHLIGDDTIELPMDRLRRGD